MNEDIPEIEELNQEHLRQHKTIREEANKKKKDDPFNRDVIVSSLILILIAIILIYIYLSK